MKRLLYLFIFIIPLSISAKTETDTITNWQIYKDGKIILKSHQMGPIYTMSIDKSENFKEIKLYILSDTRKEMTERNLLFKIDGKLIFTYRRKLKQNSDPIILSKAELLRIIGPDIAKTFTIEYRDDNNPQTTVIGKIILTSK